MTSLAIVDSGPLIAAADANDLDHRQCVAAFQDTGLRFVVPALCVAEAVHFMAKRLGAEIEASFLADLKHWDVRAPEPDDWIRIAELVRQYADFPLGGTDASVVALAERLGTDLVVTLDFRHFRAVRPRHCEALRLLPE